MNPITFPLTRHRLLGIIGSCLALLYGGLMIGALSQLPPASIPIVIFILLWLGIGLLFAGIGGVGLVRCLTTVHLMPDGVELTLCGKRFRRYPAERLKTFCLVQRGLGKSQTTHLCISTKTVDELAAVRDKQLHSDAHSRRNVALRRCTTWQEAYAGEYLRKQAQTAAVTIPGRDLLWLGFSLEIMALLRHAYPEIPWLIAPEAQSSPSLCSKDSDPTTAAFPDTKKTIDFDASGVSLVQNDRRRVLLTADAVHTIICMDRFVAAGGYYQKFLILTAASPSELIAAREKHQPPALLQLDIWPRLALRAACVRRMPVSTYWKKDAVAVPWFAARAEALRDLFSNAAWFDCTNETLFHALFTKDGRSVSNMR